MPRQDRTGPGGEGSRTGQGLGKCGPKQKNVDEMNEKEAKSYLKQILASLTTQTKRGMGRGEGNGRGGARGRGNGKRMGSNHGARFSHR